MWLCVLCGVQRTLNTTTTTKSTITFAPSTPSPFWCRSMATSGTGSASLPEMTHVRNQFLSENQPKGENALMHFEGSQMAMALGLTSEDMDLVLENEMFVSSKDITGSLLTWDSILASEPTLLRQALWKDGPMNVTLWVKEDQIGKVNEVFGKLSQAMTVGAFNVLVLCEQEKPLFEGGPRLAHSLPWGCEVVLKVHRMVAAVGAHHLQPWLLRSSEHSRQSRVDPIFKIERLLAPGTEPRTLFMTLPPPPDDLWVVCVPSNAVPRLVESAGVNMDSVVILPGPLARDNKWVLLRDIGLVAFQKLEEGFYQEEGSAFCSYSTFKGRFSPDARILQMFWRKPVRTDANLKISWRMVDWLLKNKMEEFHNQPKLQWAGANKLRVALQGEADFLTFLHSILPTLKQWGMIVKDEVTGEFLDEDDSGSVGGSSMGSSSTTAGAVANGVVVTDLPDFFRARDVEDTVRSALKVRRLWGRTSSPCRSNS